MTLARYVVRRLPPPTRRRLVEARHFLRGLTGAERVLPNLLIIGAQRCGTSSLYKYLAQHPQVTASTRKETEYLSGRYQRGEKWYRTHFPTARAVDNKDTRVTFEATPDYMLDPRAASRAADLVPDALIVALLRDPVARAYSHHRHMVRLGYEPLSLEDALDAEADRCRLDWERIAEDPTYRPLNLLRFSYVERGHYARQLDSWFDAYPSQAILLIASEDLFTSTRETFRRVQEFLGLDEWTPSHMPNHSAIASQKDPMDPSIENRLRMHFKPHNRDLTRHGFNHDWGY